MTTSTRPERPTWDGPAFPPVDDAIDLVRNIDGEALRSNARRDLHVIGKVLAFSGEQLHTFGTWLSEV